MSARVALVSLVAGFATALLIGCGIDTEEAGQGAGGGATVGEETTRTSTVNTRAAEDLPERPEGVVEVRGAVQGSLTPLATTGVEGVTINFAGVADTEGFADLCAGRIDILDTSRRITEAERRRCERNGVDLAEPLRIASDAVVIATRNEADVGGDCLRRSTVDEIFRAGSPISNWSQVGFFDIPIRVTGREAEAPAFQFFAQAVLGVPSNASLADVRSDYILHTTDDGVRREVTNSIRRQRVIDRYLPRLRELEEERDLRFQAHVDGAIDEARQRVLDDIERDNERRAEQELELSESQKRLIARNNRRRIERATEAAQRRAERDFSFSRVEILRQRARRALRRATVPGTVGVFRFSYYELYENELRPMEIWDPARAADVLEEMEGVRVETTATTGTGTSATSTSTTRTVTTATTGGTEEAPDGTSVVDPETTPWCVFPSQTTITNDSYPLARPLLLYVSRLNLEREAVRTFLLNYLDRAQTLATQQRYVPIPDTTLARNRAIVEGETPGGATTTTTATTPVTPGVATTPSTTTTTTTTTEPSG